MAQKNEFNIKTSGEGVCLYYCVEEDNIEAGHTYGPSMTDLYIIECCTHGGGTVTINGREHRFFEGDVFIIKPGTSISFSSDSVTSRKGLWCAIDGTAVASAVAAADISEEAPFLPHDVYPYAADIIRDIIRYEGDSDMGSGYRSIGAIYSLLGKILMGVPKRPENIWVERAISYMEQNYSKRINVKDVASAVGFNRSYFSTLFKGVTGVSVHDYLSEMRIRKGSVLIRDGGCSVAEAAELVGLDVQTFSGLFRKITGKSPKELKRK